MNPLPTFLVIGAQKSGTTSLYRYLRDHPEVQLSRWKEPGFFVEEQTWDRGLDWYRSLFEGGEDAIAVGEASTSYTMFPFFAGVPERIATTLPDVRLVYLLRDPVDRIRSHHRHALGEWTDEPLEQALARSPREYVVPSRYGHQLRVWRDHVSADRIHVLTTEDLGADPTGTMAQLFTFLGVDPDRAPAPETRHNVAGGHRRMPGLVQRMRRSDLYRGVRHRVPRGLRHAAWRASSRPAEVDLDRATLSAEAEARLVAELQPDLDLLAELVPGFHCWGRRSGTGSDPERLDPVRPNPESPDSESPGRS